MRNELFLLAGSQWDGAAAYLCNVDFAKVTKRRRKGMGSLQTWVDGTCFLLKRPLRCLSFMHPFIHAYTHAFIHVLTENRKLYKFINFCIYGTENFLNEVV